MFGNHSTEESEDYAAPLPAHMMPQNKPAPPMMQQPQRPLYTQQPQQARGMGADFKKQATAEVPHKAIFAAVLKFTPRDLFKLDKQGKPAGLLNGGKILLQVSDGTLTRIWCDHEADFEACDKALQERIELGVQQLIQQSSAPQQQMQLAGRKHKHNKMCRDAQYAPPRQPQQQQADNYSDIVKGIELKHVTSTWPQALNVEFPTVKKFKNEGYAGTNVGLLFIPNKLSATQGKHFTACQRVITNGNLNFAKGYPTTTLASLDHDITPIPQKGQAYIDFASAFFSIYNSDKWQNEKYTAPTHKETNQVMMPLDKAEKWMAIVKDEIAGYMCHGNVTKNFQAELSVPIPTLHRKLLNTLYEQGSPQGLQFQGFADKELQFQGQDISSMGDEYLDRQYTFNTEFHVEYYPGAGGAV